MSLPSPSYMKSPEQTAARLQALAAEGLTLPLSALRPDAPALLTAFMYFGGGEIWVVAEGADPDEATIDEASARVIGGRLVVDDAGQPASFQAVTARGSKPRKRIPLI